MAMSIVLLLSVLIILPLNGESLTCLCGSSHGVQECVENDNSSCVTNGACIAEFNTRDGDVSSMYYCLSMEKFLNIFDMCNGSVTSNKVFRCCSDEDYCNVEFMNPFTTAPPVSDGPPSSTLAPAIATPIAFLLLVILLVVVILVLVRCRKKRLERRRRDNVIEHELSCDMPAPYQLDEYTDPSGSGFGMPHLEQRTIAKSIKLGELIGSGRYGQVLLGDYQGERVAVKKFLSIDGQSWQRETEVYTANLLTHDSILRFIASDMISNNGATELWLITQYHPHGSLYDYLNKKELNAKVLMQMMTSICSGLAHLHTELYGTITKSAIAHRDIKTKNILVKSDLRCCIADFGLAVMKGNDDKLNLPKNPKQGTKRYMAPEVLDETINRNYFESFQQTDIYSVGLVFWEMCRRCGGSSGGPALDYEPPFQGLVPPDPSFDDMKAIVVKEKRQPAIPPCWLQDELLKSLIQVMRECWSYKSDARPHAVYLKKKLNKLSQEDKLDYEKAIE